MSSSYSSYAIEIIFIRSDEHGGNGPKTDDVIKVRKDYDSGEFEIIYKDRADSQSSVYHTLFSLYRQRVIDHIYLTLKSLCMDEEPFHQVQFNLPAMPSLIVSIDTFKEDYYYRDHFLELIENALDNLDVIESKRVYKSKATLRMSEDDEHEAAHLRRTLTPALDTFLRRESMNRCPHVHKYSCGHDVMPSDVSEQSEPNEPLKKKRRSSRLAATNRHLTFDD
jgi:hypothetical protein